jgi:hypothetical protein
MSQMNYENFDLEFYRTEGFPHVKARSFAGEAKHRLVLNHSLAEADRFIRSLEQSPADELKNAGPIKRFGSDLFAAVFQNDIRAIYKGGLELVSAKADSGLRVRLHLQEAPELALLPWEYLYDEATNQFLCLNRQTPIVRYLEMPKVVSPLKITPPLRILAVISSPENLPPLEAEAEKARMSQAVSDLTKRGLVAIDWLETATIAELQKALRRSQYHVFHFIGHGDFDEASQKGWLAFEDENELASRVYADQLGAILNNHRSFRLVILNSCKGARAAAANPFVGTAATLVQQGLPAVVAMQFPISDKAAIKFANEFYAAIADGAAVDVAVTEARVAIFAGENHFEWGTPVLFMRSSDGTLFEVKHASAAKKLRPSWRGALFYVLVTLFFGAITFAVLSAVPKSTMIELEVFARRVSFSLPPEIGNGEEIPLLYSALWASAISLKNFQPIELRLDSLETMAAGAAFNNPLTISAEPGEGRMTFLSTVSAFSLQDAVCDSGSKISFVREGKSLYLEVKTSSQAPRQTLSFGAHVEVSVQACKVVDGAQRELTPMFSRPVKMKLHDLSRALTVAGENGELQTSIKEAPAEGEDGALFIPRQLVQALAFSKNVYHYGEMIGVSTIDSISVKRNFPLPSAAFASRDFGDLEVAPEPNRFMIYDLSESGEGLKVRAQGRLRSLQIGRGALRSELVPKYFAVITENPMTSVMITSLGWIMTVIVPLILQFKSRHNDEDDHA